MAEKTPATTGAICGASEVLQDWQNSIERWPDKGDDRQVTDCCNRRIPLHDTKSILFSAFEGYVVDWRFECRDDMGCSINPNYKKTAHLRYYERGEAVIEGAAMEGEK